MILGNGGAAIHAAQAARSSGHNGIIQLISDNEGPTFNPMLAPYFLAGKIDFERCYPFGAQIFKDLDIDCHFGSPVEMLDPANKQVCLDNGKNFDYDQCLVATGARPVLPPVPGLKSSSHVFMLRTAQDTLHLHQALASAKTVVILGTSFIGLKLAEICLKRNMQVMLVDVAECVLPQCTTLECASAIEKKLVHEGATLYLCEMLEEVEYRLKRVQLNFQSKLSLSADLCVVCTGVRPNIDFLAHTDVAMDQGILIDDTMRSSTEGLYAAGDVSQGFNLLSGRREIIGLWGNACYQGRTAGYNMAGRKTRYPGSIQHNVTRIMDVVFASIGDVQVTGEQVSILSLQNNSDNALIELVFQDEKLVGANLLNCLHFAGKLKAAICSGWNLQEHSGLISDQFTEGELDSLLTALPPVTLFQLPKI